MSDVDRFYSLSRGSYELIAPSHEQINKALIERGETELFIDHIALRTIDAGAISLDALENLITSLGYYKFDAYEFPEKHLHAYSYSSFLDPKYPRIFLSGYDISHLTDRSRPIINGLIEQVGDQISSAGTSALFAGRLWDMISFGEYETLAAESEYLAWFATMGFQPNHYALNLNGLETISGVEDMLTFVESLGYKINVSGGRVKGTPKLLLEQGSTMADRIPVVFRDGEAKSIPGGYYEFAMRYPASNGKLYDGFISSSADKIFESTDGQDVV